MDEWTICPGECERCGDCVPQLLCWAECGIPLLCRDCAETREEDRPWLCNECAANREEHYRQR
jgi:hypothetical protein